MRLAEISPRWGKFNPFSGGRYMTPADASLKTNWQFGYDLSDLTGWVLDGSNRVICAADRSGNSGVNVLALNGVTGNSATVPAVAAFGGATELDVYIHVTPCVANTSDHSLFGQYYSAGNKRSWIVDLGYGGTEVPGLFISANGITGYNINPSLTHGGSAIGTGYLIYQSYWLRINWRASDQRVQYFTHADQPTKPSAASMTQLGVDQTMPGSVAALYTSDQAIYVGGKQDQTTNEPGNFYYVDAAVTNGGTPVLAIDFTKASKLATTFVCDTGQTVTINTSGDLGARICGARDLVQLTAAKRPVYLPFSGTQYAYFSGVAGYTVSCPLANNTYTATITYLDGTTDTESVVVAAGTATLGGTDAKFSKKSVKTISLTLSAVEQALFNAANYSSGTTFVDSHGITWTLNSGACIVTAPSLYFDGVDDYMKSAPFALAAPEYVSMVAAPLTYTGFRYFVDGGGAVASTLVLEIRNSANIGIISGADHSLVTSLPAVSTRCLASARFNGSSSSIGVNRGALTTGTTDDVAPNGITLATQATTLNYFNYILNELNGFSVVPSSYQRDRLAVGFGRKWKISL